MRWPGARFLPAAADRDATPAGRVLGVRCRSDSAAVPRAPREGVPRPFAQAPAHLPPGAPPT